MQIKQASKASGLPPRTIRYYESRGLIRSQRAANGYRHYHSDDIERLQFLQRARALGFSLEECADLLALQRDPNRASAQVRDIAEQHLVDVDAKIEQLQQMKAQLSDWIRQCPGDASSHCSILEGLAQGESQSA
ncbi:Cu(I)-responsive transcriptional regulator [Saccharospirillum sp. MSK14-1]|uniref:MerR family DNA-binding protein n=1 Tax=Saccharospirillum sp. MSK14-1 TaxID=1897632 RepID=UPI000D33A15E|nr:MerR family DNA-binding protein [Saccharospirillum sp. MSK14-1]PTY36974.1 Cu(I)-responsive transcriptional regulator [Saccharospirillum sp. MSK14-1]